MTFSRTHILGECRIPLSLVRMSGMQHGSRKVGMDFRVFSSWFELQPAANTESPTTTRKSVAGPPGLLRTMTNTTPGVNGEIHLVLAVVCAPSHKDAHTKHLPDPWSLEKNRLNIELESKTPVFDEYVVFECNRIILSLIYTSQEKRRKHSRTHTPTTQIWFHHTQRTCRKMVVRTES